MANHLLTRIRLAFGCFVLVLAVIAGLFASHHLSAAGFLASVGLVLTVSAVILARFVLRMRNLARLPDPLDRVGRETIRLRFAVNAACLALIVICLSLALWETRNRPASPHTALFIIGVLCTFTALRSLRRDYARLKQTKPRRTP